MEAAIPQNDVLFGVHVDAIDQAANNDEVITNYEPEKVATTTKRKPTPKRKPKKKYDSDDEGEDSDDWEPSFTTKSPKTRQKKEKLDDPKPRKTKPIDESKLTLRLHVRKTTKELKDAGRLAVSVHDVWEKVIQHPEFTKVKHSSMCPLFYGTTPSRDFLKVARKKDSKHLLYALRDDYDEAQVKAFLDKEYPGHREPFDNFTFISSLQTREPKSNEKITLLQESDSVPSEFIPRSDQPSPFPASEAPVTPSKPVETRYKKEKEESEFETPKSEKAALAIVEDEDDDYQGSESESEGEGRDGEWGKKKSAKRSGDLYPVLKIMREMKEHGLEAALPYQIEHMLKEAEDAPKLNFSVAHRLYVDSENKYAEPLFVKVALLESEIEHSIFYAIKKGMEMKKVKQFLGKCYGWTEKGSKKTQTRRRVSSTSKSPKVEPQPAVVREAYNIRARKQEEEEEKMEDDFVAPQPQPQTVILKLEKQEVEPDVRTPETAPPLSPPEETAKPLSEADQKQRAEQTAQWAVKLLNALREESIPAALIHELLPLMQEFYDTEVQAEEVMNCVANRKEFVRIAVVKSYVTDTLSFVYAVREGLDIAAIKNYLQNQYGEYEIVHPEFKNPEPEISLETQGDGTAATTRTVSS